MQCNCRLIFYHSDRKICSFCMKEKPNLVYVACASKSTVQCSIEEGLKYQVVEKDVKTSDANLIIIL
jgi:hypothetical protein